MDSAQASSASTRSAASSAAARWASCTRRYDPLIERVVALKTIRADQLAGERRGRDHRALPPRSAGRGPAHPSQHRRRSTTSARTPASGTSRWSSSRAASSRSYFEAERALRDGRHRAHHDADPGARSATRTSSGVVHRDIKPANVFLLADGTVKVADFGIAHIESSNLTQVGTVLGTPSYMSPEQILGLPVDGRSDLFSVRRHPLPVPHRRAAVHRLADDHDAQGAGGRSAAAVALQRADSRRDGRRRAQGARQEARRALPVRRRIRRTRSTRGRAGAVREPTAASSRPPARAADRDADDCSARSARPAAPAPQPAGRRRRAARSRRRAAHRDRRRRVVVDRHRGGVWYRAASRDTPAGRKRGRGPGGATRGAAGRTALPRRRPSRRPAAGASRRTAHEPIPARS